MNNLVFSPLVLISLAALPVIVSAAVVSVFLDQQKRRHNFEIQVEYEKLGMKWPKQAPKLRMLESIAMTIVGLLIGEIGGIMLVSYIGMIHFHYTPGRNATEFMLGFLVLGAVFFLAAGLATVILGVRGVSANIRYMHCEREIKV